MKMTGEQMLDLVKDLVTATLEMIEIEQKINISDASRVSNILDEATTRLRNSFNEMDATVESTAMSKPTLLVDQYQQLRQDSLEILQFDDIVSQIMVQCTKRGEAMLSSLYRLYEVIETLEMHDPYVDLARMRARFRREALRHKSTLNQFDSVKQESLENGDIEIF